MMCIMEPILFIFTFLVEEVSSDKNELRDVIWISGINAYLFYLEKPTWSKVF
jgi:hypothetical protein